MTSVPPKKLFRVIFGGTFKAHNVREAEEICSLYKDLVPIRITHIKDEHYDPQLDILIQDINKFTILNRDDPKLDMIETHPDNMRIWRYNKERETMIVEAKVKNRDDVVALIYLSEGDKEIKVIYCHASLINNEITWIVKTEYEHTK